MASLNRAPGIMLRGSVLFFFVRMPSYGSRIKKNIRASKSSQSSALWIPLIPANQRTNSTSGGIECLESQITRSEIIFLVESGIVGNVHLSVDAQHFAI